MRSGFTLIEIIVALFVFEIGMLGLTALGAVAARDFATAGRVAGARALARNRVELLHSAACVGAASGEAIAGAFTEHWRVRRDGARLAFSDSVAFQLPRARHGFVRSTGSAVCVE